MKEYLKNNPILVSALFVAVSIVYFGDALSRAIINYKEADRKVVVKGLSEKEVPANKITWPLIYKELGNDPAEMYRILESKNGQVVEFLNASGITTEEITINPPTIIDRQADNYGNEIMTFRYKATSVITVSSTNVEKVRQLMRQQTELMKKGIALVHEEFGDKVVQYEFTDLNQIKPAMIEEATLNARLTAQKFADDSNAKLGSILHATQGQFSIENRDANSPHIKRIRVVNTIEYALK